MIEKLVQSALQTGWLSVESEALIRQLLDSHRFQTNESEALKMLNLAVRTGQVKRESRVQSYLSDPC